MEARKLDQADHPSRDYASEQHCEVGELDQPFSWGGLIGLVHPYVWAAIAALWIGLACVVLYEAS
jgi:hypothetical protein